MLYPLPVHFLYHICTTKSQNVSGHPGIIALSWRIVNANFHEDILCNKKCFYTSA